MAAILNLLDLRSAQGALAQYLRAFFGQKENFNVYFSGKRRSLLHPKTAQRSFFLITIIFFKEKLARKARVHMHTDASISDRAHASLVSHNAPWIQLIQYGLRIGKKVYCYGTVVARINYNTWLKKTTLDTLNSRVFYQDLPSFQALLHM